MKRSMVLTAAAGAALAVALAPMQTDRQKLAQYNAKQLSLGLLMYSMDYDDLLPWPQDTKTMFAVTYPYLKNREVLKTHNPSGSQFLFNMALGGVSTNTVDAPAATPMYYESKAWADGKRVVAYLDGHALLVDKAKWAKDSKLLKKKWKRTAKKPLPKNYAAELSRMFGGG